MFLRSKMPTRRRILSLGAQALLMLAVYLAARAWMQKDMVSGVIPSIESQDLTGKPVSLADYRDGPVLVHFWATWCSVCEFEKGAISKVNEDWPVLSIAMQSGNTAQITNYMEKNQLDWRTIVDDTGRIASKFGVHGVPATFVVDRDGNIKFKETGITTSWGLRLRLWLSQ